MATSSTGPSRSSAVTGLEVPHQLGDAYFGLMGIQLSDFDKQVIGRMADYKSESAPTYPYLFGMISSSLHLFFSGHSEKSDLESMWALVQLLERLCKTYNAEQLREISCGTREVPGEDVPSGQ